MDDTDAKSEVQRRQTSMVGARWQADRSCISAGLAPVPKTRLYCRRVEESRPIVDCVSRGTAARLEMEG